MGKKITPLPYLKIHGDLPSIHENTQRVKGLSHMPIGDGNHNPDKIWRRIKTAFAFIAAIVIAIVCIINQPIAAQYGFSTEGYYIPISTVDRKSNAANEAYESYVSMRSVECPGFVSNRKPSGTIYQTNGVYAGRGSNLRFTHFFFTREEIEGDNDAYNPIKRATIAGVLELNTDVEGIKDLKFEEMLKTKPKYNGDPNGTTAVYEIVAPFSFTYENYNMDVDRQKIVILNGSKTCRITIDKVANWFCAGLPGTSMQNDSRQSEETVSWAEHYNSHLTWIGKHNNSKKLTGTAGELLGYGDSNTTFTIEIHDSSGWRPATWQEIYNIS